MKARHLPCTLDEMKALGWDRPDVAIVTGDAHVDHPAFPAAVLGRVLESGGFRVCIIARPDPRNADAIALFGIPRLFFGVTAGSLDSMVANYTALKKTRSDDPYAPGGRAGGRPDRAVTAYCNMIRRKFGKAAFIVAGGIEASLRKFAHYDFWSDSVRRPLLMDCGANILVHGMGEGPVLEIARKLREAGGDSASDAAGLVPLLSRIPGVVYRVPKREAEPSDGAGLPSAEQVEHEPRAHMEAYRLLEANRGKTIWQNCGGMRVIANPGWLPTAKQLDSIYGLPFTREAHPMYKGMRIPALETVRFSVTSHRGCFGGCAFCAVGAHQGKTIVSRSKRSIVDEIARIAQSRDFRGTITDVGGPTANMYGTECRAKSPCNRPSCLWPEKCASLGSDQHPYLELLKAAARTSGVKHLFVGTGIRMDLALTCEPLLYALAFEHTSGHLKVAPEHIAPGVLRSMRKPAGDHFRRFLAKHREMSRRAGKEQYVIPYFIAAHPGCAMEDMKELADFLKRERIIVEQCQIFTPTPGTISTAMYATGLDFETGKPIYVEKNPRRKEEQKAAILYHLAGSGRRGRGRI